MGLRLKAGSSIGAASAIEKNLENRAGTRYEIFSGCCGAYEQEIGRTGVSRAFVEEALRCPPSSFDVG